MEDPRSLSIALNSFFISITSLSFYHILSPLVIPVPSEIAKIENKYNRNQAYRRYIAIYASFVHSIAALIITSVILYKDGITFDAVNVPHHYYLFGMSLGYYLVDTCASTFLDYGTRLMNFHHTISIFFFIYMLTRGRYGGYFMFVFWVGEISNPVFHLRKNLLVHSGMKKLKIVISVIFAVTFFCFRAIVPYLTVDGLMESTISYFFKLLILNMWFLSLIWVSELLYFVVKEVHSTFNTKQTEVIYGYFKSLRDNKKACVAIYCAELIFVFYRIFYSTKSVWF